MTTETEAHPEIERPMSEEIVKKEDSVASPTEVRESRSLETAVVDGHIFGLLPALEGKWSGDAQSFKGQHGSSSIKVAYEAESETWEVRNTTGDPNGLADVHTTHLKPVAHGVCREFLGGKPTGLTYEEKCGDLFATLIQRCKKTGVLQRIEVWALQSHTGEEPRLTRTSTMYTHGDVAKVIVSRERKVQ
mmetsp:Transcript_32033/g.85810  ORF Transcript_32033/g.85810 Transcript_32033/m.85810 type:complete len:190 (-) Transcript_32033:129-698(-)